jgi:hypothetical protein
MSERLVATLRSSGDQWLWEMVWRLNDEFPALEVGTKVALVRQAVLGLTLKAGIELWRGQWPTGPVAPLSQEEMARILAEDAPWHDPENSDLLIVVQVAEPG